jgi:hypothetical protein
MLVLFMTYSHLVGEGSSCIYLLNISGANLQIMTSGGYHLRTKTSVAGFVPYVWVHGLVVHTI